MADGGSLFGLIRDIGERREAAKVRDVMRQNDYFNKPLAAINAVNDAGYMDAAVSLRDQEAQRQAAQAKAAEGGQERYRGALLSITQGLKGVRDQGGDVAGELGKLAPVLSRGFGMQPEEIVELQTQVRANPGILDRFEEMFADPTKAKFGVVTPGGAIYDQRTGQITGNNPALAKTVKLKNGDGTESLYVMGGDGSFIPATMGGAPAGTSAAPGQGGGAGVYSGPLGINPQARGVRNGNPGNIKDGPWARKQPGYAGSDGTFAKFQPGFGEKAQETLLRNHYVNGQRSVNDIVNKYLGGAANKENSDASQRNYKAYVAGRLGINGDTVVTAEQIPLLGQAMREFENGTRVKGSGQVQPVATSTPAPGGGKGWRDLSEAEKKERGLEPTRAYQIGISGANTGKITQVGGQAAVGKAGKPAGSTLQAQQTAVGNMQKLRDAARKLRSSKSFDQATGSIQGRLPSVFQGTVDFDTQLDAYKNKVVIQTLTAMKQASPNGASGWGSLTEKEGERLEQSDGPLRQSSPATLRSTLNDHERDAQISIGLLFNIPPAATAKLLANPKLAADFDAKYGKGLARTITGR